MGQVILFVGDGSASLPSNCDAASIEVAADISALLDKVGLKGPKLAASKGDEEGLALQLTAELKLAMEGGARVLDEIEKIQNPVRVREALLVLRIDS